jgi:hypothetical protein
MTLVAQLTINKEPMLIGDVLLSSESRTGMKVNLPLIGDINKILSDNGFPFEVDFAQKLHIFNGRIAVGWSGPSIQAKRALEVISAISTQDSLTQADIERELRAVDQEKINQLQLVGLVIEDTTGPNVQYSVFAMNAPFMDVPNFGRVCGAGSGASAFFELLQKGNWLAQANANAYMVAHGLLGALTNQEYRTGNTIANRWGGGFEALTFSSNSKRLEKIRDVLHTFWVVKDEHDDAIGMLPFFYKTTYWHDVLILRTASVEQLRDDTFNLKTNDITLIPPVLKSIEDYDRSELGEVDFSYRAVCCHVLIEKESNRDLELIVDQRQSSQDLIFRVIQSKGQLQLTDYLPNMIKERLKLRKGSALGTGSSQKLP